MRPYLAVLSVAAAFAVPAAPSAPATATNDATVVAYAEPVDHAVPHIHDHATHDHATHDHAAPPQPQPQVEPPPFDTGWVTTPHKTPRRLTYGRWRTPEAAARYLAAAYTHHDDTALRHVTTPDARTQLADMRGMAADLRLVRCTDSDWGFYYCTFSHALKGTTKRGHAELQFNPARKQGWYADALIGCG